MEGVKLSKLNPEVMGLNQGGYGFESGMGFFHCLHILVCCTVTGRNPRKHQVMNQSC